MTQAKKDEWVRAENVWDAAGHSPAEAQNLRARNLLMMAIEQIIKERGLTQAKAAKLLGVTQPRISDLMRRHIDRFSLDALVEMLARAGYRVELTIRQAA
jgi:predicted XRE-type DNA-binding protein